MVFKLYKNIMTAICQCLYAIGFTPNRLTVLGLCFAACGALLLVSLQPLLALLFFTLAGWCDMLDGYMARHYQLQSNFGAMLDSLSDRVADFAMMLSLLYFVAENRPFVFFLAAWSMVMVSLVSALHREKAIKIRFSVARREIRFSLLWIGLLVEIIWPQTGAVVLSVICVICLSCIHISANSMHLLKELRR